MRNKTKNKGSNSLSSVFSFLIGVAVGVYLAEENKLKVTRRLEQTKKILTSRSKKVVNNLTENPK